LEIYLNCEVQVSFFMISGIRLYSMLGIPHYKMVLGLPWYGYDYPCTSYNAVVSDC